MIYLSLLMAWQDDVLAQDGAGEDDVEDGVNGADADGEDEEGEEDDDDDTVDDDEE